MPFYESLSTQQLSDKAEKAEQKLESCDLCPRKCGVNRLKGETGFCGAGDKVKINSIFPHHGEEPVLSGQNGSGTVFFCHCTMGCIFCQNHRISQQYEGEYVTAEALASGMLRLQEQGCHNINLVTPTHYVPQIIQALSVAIPKGLRIPIVYNTNGYDALETLRLLDGLIDIYLPDIKYADDQYAKNLSACPDYVQQNRTALTEMWNQVGPLITDENGMALQGLVVRHLVLPNGQAGTAESMKWLAGNLGKEVAVSMMAQYQPVYRASKTPSVDRRITKEEYIAAVSALKQEGLQEGWIQDWQGIDGSYLYNSLVNDE